MEEWDLYDNEGTLLDKTHFRGIPIPPGEYHLVVTIWIRNHQNQFLIQKRTKPIGNLGKVWACTAGSAIKGESSIEAAKRETFEEMGLYFSYHDFTFIERFIEDDFLMDVYEVIWDSKSDFINYERSEVSSVQWVTKEELRTLYENKKFFDYGSQYCTKLLDEFIEE